MFFLLKASANPQQSWLKLICLALQSFFPKRLYPAIGRGITHLIDKWSCPIWKGLCRFLVNQNTCLSFLLCHLTLVPHRLACQMLNQKTKAIELVIMLCVVFICAFVFPWDNSCGYLLFCLLNFQGDLQYKSII